MAHSYRTLQHWNQWLTQHFLGSQLLEVEQVMLTSLLNNHFGKHMVLIGVPHQNKLLEASHLPIRTLISPLTYHGKNLVSLESDLHELPILTGSIDLALLPHTLEFIDNPRQLLAEVCRIIKPQGLIAICGFNPYSIWGIRKLFAKKKRAPWSGNFIQAGVVKSWLHLADFELEQQKHLLFRPPINKSTLYQKLHFMEHLGSRCCPIFGGAYLLLARAKVVPLTPIRLKWKQHLSGVRISPIIPGHIARRSQLT